VAGHRLVADLDYSAAFLPTQLFSIKKNFSPSQRSQRESLTQSTTKLRSNTTSTCRIFEVYYTPEIEKATPKILGTVPLPGKIDRKICATTRLAISGLTIYVDGIQGWGKNEFHSFTRRLLQWILFSRAHGPRSKSKSKVNSRASCWL
jgi:hypothetical protein